MNNNEGIKNPNVEPTDSVEQPIHFHCWPPIQNLWEDHCPVSLRQWFRDSISISYFT
jgi:hypothetical protein